MLWGKSWRADPLGNAIAKRHYTCQSPDSRQFVPPGRCVVLRATNNRALWVTSWPFARYVKHAWAGAWVNSLFRNEGAGLASDLIRQAVAATRYEWPDVPPLGMVTFIDEGAVRHKRDPGRCYLRAGFRYVTDAAGERVRTKDRGYLVLQLLPADMPPAEPPTGLQLSLLGERG